MITIIIIISICPPFVINNYAMKKGLEPLPAELVEKGELPLLVILAISGACFLLLLVNAGLICWYVIKRKAKGKFISFFFLLFTSLI